MAPLKITTKEIISRFEKVHGTDKYDYSKMEYVRSDVKIKVTCKKHGDFLILPNHHWRGIGCKKCGIESKIIKTTKSNIEVIDEIKSIFKDEDYDYSKTMYQHSETKIKIICKQHGEFEQLISNIRAVFGCPECLRLSKLPIRKNSFIEQSNNIHQNKYDYSLIKYIDSTINIKIICPEHGVFEQTPANHLKGKGCSKCGDISSAEKQTYTTEEFINKAMFIHNGKYDYSKVEYKNSSEKVIIICNVENPDSTLHGEFKQNTTKHLMGQGCPSCAGKIGTTEEFIRKSIEIHGDVKYSYHKVEYVHPLEPVCIHCMITDEDGLSHGDFYQIPSSHLQGQGCSKCANSGTSKQEQSLITFIKSLNINIIERSRNLIYSEIDIFIPSKKIAIEYNGLYWHNELNKPDTKYHLRKTEACEKQGIQLIHIFEDEWIEKESIVKSRLKNLFGLSDNAIYARKCEIRTVSIIESKIFLDTNHIQGNVNSRINLGLYYNNELVSLMTFGDLRKNLGQEANPNEYELLRFCNKLSTNVVGGASKLFKHFKTIYNPNRIISYADRRWSVGKLYETLKFTFKHDSVPNYFYVIRDKRHNRFGFRKDILISKYGCLESDTEHNFCFNQKWYRIYDCGAKVYEWIK